MDWLAREAMLIGQPALERLSKARVAVVGIGGVGGAAAEALCRAGIGHLFLMDYDIVEPSNLNRQLFALRSTVGLKKTQAAQQRLLDISPECEIVTADCFYSEHHRDILFSFQPDYVLDAADTVTAKLDLAEQCNRREIPLLTCLGTGNRLDPSRFRIGGIEETAGCGCPLARVMRRELRRRGLEHQKVLYSTELPIPAAVDSGNGRHSPGSISFVPPAAGLLMAGEVVRSLIGQVEMP